MAATPPDLSALFPGFDALQGLTRGAGAPPGLGAWVTPTIDPDELGKRIEELKTVQFWLDQNSRLISTTIQAMEVQRMTLTTLRTMNVQARDLAEAFKIRWPEQEAAPKDPAPPSAAAPGSPSTAASASASAPKASPKASRSAPSRKTAAGRSGSSGDDPPPAGLADPMRWWGALAQQFTQIAAQTLKDAPTSGAGAPQAARDVAASAPGSRRAGTPKKPAHAPTAAHDPGGTSGGGGASGRASGRAGAEARGSRAASASADAGATGARRGRTGRGPERS